MNKRSIAALAVLLALISAPLFSAAAEFKAGEQVSFAKGETLIGDLYMAGSSVASEGTVWGDLTAAGGSVLVNSQVGIDLFVVGGNITVLGRVSDDVKAAGGNIVIKGDIGGDAVIGGGQINLSGSSIGGDVVIGGGEVRIDAVIEGNLRVGGGNVYINAPIKGDAKVYADKVTLGPNALVSGDLWYSSPKEAVFETGAAVEGETTYKPVKRGGEFGGRYGTNAILAGLSVWLLAKFLMIFVAALALVLAFRRFGQELVALAAAKPLSEFFRGLVSAIVLPVFSAILVATVVGMPLGIIGLLTFLIMLVFSACATPVVVGPVLHKLLFRKSSHEVNWKTVLLGTLALFLVGLIPFVGWLVVFVAMMITLGATLKLKWGVAKTWR